MEEAVLFKIVEDTQESIGYQFSMEEIIEILSHTIRKCELNGKGEEYIPILFENELRDYVMVNAINYFSILNRKGAAVNV